MQVRQWIAAMLLLGVCGGLVALVIVQGGEVAQVGENAQTGDNAQLGAEYVDLTYLAQHMGEFENKKVMLTGTVAYLENTSIGGEFRLGEENGGVPVLLGENLEYPTENFVVAVEGMVLNYEFEGGFYAVFADNWSYVEPEENYAPGVIVVDFIDNVTENQVREVVESIGLSLESYHPYNQYFLAKYTGEMENVDAEIELSDSVNRASKGLDPQEIFISFKPGVTYNEALEFINSFENLAFITNLKPPWGVVGVPVGQETEWAENIKNIEIVESATLNWTGTVWV